MSLEISINQARILLLLMPKILSTLQMYVHNYLELEFQDSCHKSLQSYPSLWTLISLIYSATLESQLHVPYCSVFIISVLPFGQSVPFIQRYALYFIRAQKGEQK